MAGWSFSTLLVWQVRSLYRRRSTWERVIRRLIPVSQSGEVEGDRCGGGVDFLDAGGVCIKPITCFCNYLGPPYHSIPCLTVPVGPSTWGRVKAMYR